uniref:Spindle and kinetochore-associated protein 1 n=1 Tax=Sphaerodactylus townsendi TaxID=933632 RepID=A0ACB8EQA9_9SAUR
MISPSSCQMSPLFDWYPIWDSVGGESSGGEEQCVEVQLWPSRYMRGRLTYSQVNAVIQEINKAVASKYKIVRQSTKSMSSVVRNLYIRFQEQETKDTKGEFFIVEADIEEFTQLKADKRFHSILTILRHCQRVREIRGSRLVRYAVC